MIARLRFILALAMVVSIAPVLTISTYAQDRYEFDTLIFVDTEEVRVHDDGSCSLDDVITQVILDIDTEPKGGFAFEIATEGRWYELRIDGSDLDSGCLFIINTQTMLDDTYIFHVSILTEEDQWAIDLGEMAQDQISGNDDAIAFVINEETLESGEGMALDSDLPEFAEILALLDDDDKRDGGDVKIEHDDGEYLSVLIVLLPGLNVDNIVSSTDTPGASCHGIGQYAPITEGATGSVTNVRGAQDVEGQLTAGTVDQYGHCRLAFAVPLFDADEYLFGIDDDLFVICGRDDLAPTNSGLVAEIRFAPNAAYCQPL